ncbi:MAG: anthranilate phosphoribosyltransferase [Chthoniobacterales bacterium]|nr:anthranilate phosphoribosyltransferase [Chthoniobacterales bacterium]
MNEWTSWIRSGGKLDAAAVGSIVGELLGGRAGDEEKADFLEALHQRGESPHEIRLFALAFLDRAVPFPVTPEIGGVLDVCGTGGDRLGLFNISTAVMFVAAGAGARLVKHGNRGITSQSGGADVLEALGVPPDVPEDRLQGMLEEAGAVFLFAPRFHPAFKSVAPARKILASRGSPSIFNMLGPLLNPARPAYQLTGVFSEALLPLYAEVLPGLQRESAWIVHGSAGGTAVMDEISTLGPTLVAEVQRGNVTHRELQQADLGVPPGDIEELRGGDAERNAAFLEEILDGRRHGSARDIVLVNSAAALRVAGLAEDWPEAMARAGDAIDSGSARDVLATMRRVAGGG